MRGDIWDVDRLNHLYDLPRYCPDCSAALSDRTGIRIEYWQADRRVYHVWCGACGWSGDVVRVTRMIGPQAVD